MYVFLAIISLSLAVLSISSLNFTLTMSFILCFGYALYKMDIL